MTNTTTHVPSEAEQPQFRFIDDGKPWRLGETCLTAEAILSHGSVPFKVGTIEFDYDREEKKPCYRALNVDGTRLFPPAHSLAELKGRFHAYSNAIIPYALAYHEARSIDPLLARTQIEPVESPYVEKKSETRAAKLQSARVRSKSRSRNR